MPSPRACTSSASGPSYFGRSTRLYQVWSTAVARQPFALADVERLGKPRRLDLRGADRPHLAGPDQRVEAGQRLDERRRRVVAMGVIEIDRVDPEPLAATPPPPPRCRRRSDCRQSRIWSRSAPRRAGRCGAAIRRSASRIRRLDARAPRPNRLRPCRSSRRRASTKRSSRSNASSPRTVQPKTLPPSTSRGVSRPLSPRGLRRDHRAARGRRSAGSTGSDSNRRIAPQRARGLRPARSIWAATMSRPRP